MPVIGYDSSMEFLIINLHILSYYLNSVAIQFLYPSYDFNGRVFDKWNP